jgi:hypothetical protein
MKHTFILDFIVCTTHTGINTSDIISLSERGELLASRGCVYGIKLLTTRTIFNGRHNIVDCVHNTGSVQSLTVS